MYSGFTVLSIDIYVYWYGAKSTKPKVIGQTNSFILQPMIHTLLLCVPEFVSESSYIVFSASLFRCFLVNPLNVSKVKKKLHQNKQLRLDTVTAKRSAVLGKVRPVPSTKVCMNSLFKCGIWWKRLNLSRLSCLRSESCGKSRLCTSPFVLRSVFLIPQRNQAARPWRASRLLVAVAVSGW